MKKNYDRDNELKIEEVKDLIYSIEKNTGINNRKAGNLIYAYRSFRAANILIGLLSLLLLLSIYFAPTNETPKVIIENPVELKDLNTSIQQIKNELKNNTILNIGDSVKIIRLK